ncbi:MAG: hypothetical protein CFE44_06015 [Burkholderiales bacterium PBB4]|nr:MAG: hypothetical protein CFE44_06015 [Burkholderiales bacterium PBB4]
MTDQELSDFLVAKGAAVVHLSHHAVMDPNRPIWPEDMRRAIAKRAALNLSCVVAWPGHPMSLPGSVGVICKPACAHVISAAGSDSGSTMLPDGSDGSAGLSLTPDSLAATFEVAPGSYNEWRVRGAEVVGIFIADPTNIYVKKAVRLSAGGVEFDDVAATRISIDEVFAEFPRHPVFTFGVAGLVEIRRP